MPMILSFMALMVLVRLFDYMAEKSKLFRTSEMDVYSGASRPRR